MVEREKRKEKDRIQNLERSEKAEEKENIEYRTRNRRISKADKYSSQ